MLAKGFDNKDDPLRRKYSTAAGVHTKRSAWAAQVICMGTSAQRAKA